MRRAVAYVHPAGHLLSGRTADRGRALDVLSAFRTFIRHPDLHHQITARLGQPRPRDHAARSRHVEDILAHVRATFLASHLSQDARHWLWQVGRRVLHGHDDVEDALWSFLGQRLDRVCARWDRRRPFLPLLVTAFERHCLDRRRRSAHVRRHEHPTAASLAWSRAAEPGEDEAGALAPLRAAIAVAFSELRPSHRTILEDVHRHGGDYAAIARARHRDDDQSDADLRRQRCNALHQLHHRAKNRLLERLAARFGHRDDLEDSDTFDALMEWFFAAVDVEADA